MQDQFYIHSWAPYILLGPISWLPDDNINISHVATTINKNNKTNKNNNSTYL